MRTHLSQSIGKSQFEVPVSGDPYYSTYHDQFEAQAAAIIQFLTVKSDQEKQEIRLCQHSPNNVIIQSKATARCSDTVNAIKCLTS